ncbi:hypothetical protein AAF712_002571 [Marasmius tenuissimus]|uniref:Uncharacterized protein n=1 Tax=Marasmius tenuissimus TaxID=585030 RepID=A0ABR3A8S5_9AGAR
MDLLSPVSLIGHYKKPVAKVRRAAGDKRKREDDGQDPESGVDKGGDDRGGKRMRQEGLSLQQAVGSSSPQRAPPNNTQRVSGSRGNQRPANGVGSRRREDDPKGKKRAWDEDNQGSPLMKNKGRFKRQREDYSDNEGNAA